MGFSAEIGGLGPSQYEPFSNENEHDHPLVVGVLVSHALVLRDGSVGRWNRGLMVGGRAGSTAGLETQRTGREDVFFALGFTPRRSSSSALSFHPSLFSSSFLSSPLLFLSLFVLGRREGGEGRGADHLK